MYKKAIGLTDVDLAAIDRVIDAQGITEFRARDIVAPRLSAVECEHEIDKEERENSDDRAARLVLRALDRANDWGDMKRMQVGNVTIERGQYIPELRLVTVGERGSKVVGAVSFIYPGNEISVITTAVAPIANVLHKLHLHGNFCVSDGLLFDIAAAFPLLRSVRIETQQRQLVRVTSQGLAAFVSSLARLEVLRLQHLGTAVQHLSMSSSILRKLHLTGFLALQTFSLSAPKLTHLWLETNPTASLLLPGPGATLESLQELRCLHLGHCIQNCEQVQGLGLSRLESIGVASSTMAPEVMLHLLSLIRWEELTSLDLAAILTDAHIARIGAFGYASLQSLHLRTMPGSSLTATALAGMGKACVVLSTFHIHDDMLTVLTVESSSLIEVLIGGTRLEQLSVDCPSLDVFHLQSCPQLRPANLSFSCNQLSDAYFDDTVDVGVTSLIVPFVQKQQSFHFK